MPALCSSRLSACAALAALALLVIGCETRPTADQALDKALKRAGKTKETVYPLAGRVTIDGQPPQLDLRNSVVAILIDRQKIGEPAVRHPFAECDRNGGFAFSSYDFNDGVKPGSYVIAIAKFKRDTRPGAYIGPDQFHNLYNDPDKNALNGQFRIEHSGPGKKDYEFPLSVAGAQPNIQAGLHAVTSIP
jgi:hypothetical protein